MASRNANLESKRLAYQIFSIWWNFAELIGLFENLWEIHLGGPAKETPNLTLGRNMQRFPLSKTTVRFAVRGMLHCARLARWKVTEFYINFPL